MIDSHAGVRAPRSNRPELVAAHGYDTKFAMHMIRLGMHGVEFMETGKIELPIPDPYGQYLRDVRHGAYSFDEVINVSNMWVTELGSLIEDSDLPARADQAWVNTLIWELHRMHWDI